MGRATERAAGAAELVVRRGVWVLLAWVAFAAVLNLAVPQIEEVAARDSTPVVPEHAPTIQAVSEMDEAFGNGRSNSYLVVAMEREGGLTRADRAYLGGLVEELREDEDVAFVQDPRGRPEFLDSLTSEDGEARYLQVGITGNTGAPDAQQQLVAVRDISRDLAPDGLTVEVTGTTATIADLTDETERSVVRITVVTVVLIALILLYLYRSISVTVVVLTMVGLGLGIARAVTAWMGDVGIFQVSTFTGSFLTAVVLGAGTDYAIFLVSRYHEERRAGVSPAAAAAAATAKIAGVVAGSALTVVLATAAMGFADLGIFRTTGPAVAVGVAVNLVLSLTLMPALLALAGSRGWAEPRPERGAALWQRVAAGVAARPARMAAAALVPLVALAALYPLLELSLDSRSSQPDDTGSNRGYALLERHFPINEVLPDFVLIQADHDLRNPRDLALLELAADSVARQDGVEQVRGITRPSGEPITQASVAYQSGIIGGRLDDAAGEVAHGEDGASQLADGAGQLADGAGQLDDGAGRLADGTDRAVGGAGDLADGTARLEDGVRRLLAGADRAADGSARLRRGMDELADGLELAADQVSLAVDGLGLAYDALQNKSLTCGLDPACRRARDGIKQIWIAERDRLLPGLERAARAARQLADGTGDLSAGLAELRSGLDQARDGVDRLAAGQRLFEQRLGDLADGADQLADGADELADGAGRLEGGTEEVAASLPELRRGLDRAASYLNRTGTVARDPAIGGFYLPPTALADSRLEEVSGLFLSEDGRTARLLVLGETDAFGRAAADRAVVVHEAVEMAFADTRLEDAEVRTTGVASINADLVHYSDQDLRLVAGFALLAVFLVLLALLRSLVAATFLMATVVLSYVAAIGLAVLVWQILLDQPLDWAVPAIAFVLLVAVGADYNLLLVKRMHEEAPDGSAEGIARATAVTGSVITSAGLIFAGSMFALMAGTVSSLAQMGFTVGMGLLLDTFVVRSWLVPAVATLLGPRLWWPARVAAPADAGSRA